MKEEIIKIEEELRQAMLTGDINKLDTLISDSLLFMAPNGVAATKQMDLNAHKSGIQKMTKLSPSEQQIETYDNLAIVTVKMQMEGTYGGTDISGDYRYIRTWAKINSHWQIVAGAVIQLQG